MSQRLLVAIAVASITMLAACSDSDETPTGPTAIAQPQPDPIPGGRIVHPADSQVVTFRVVFMHLDSVTTQNATRAIFYVDGHAEYDAVDNCAPWVYATFNANWVHGSWHSIYAIIQDSTGELSYSDTIDVLFLPKEQYDTLIQDVIYDDYMDRGYVITSRAYTWTDHEWLVPWFDAVAEGDWALASITSEPERKAVARLGLNSGAYWLAGHLDSALTWNWNTGDVWNYEYWFDPQGAPADSARRGLLMLGAGGYWVGENTELEHPMLLKVDYTTGMMGGYP